MPGDADPLILYESTGVHFIDLISLAEPRNHTDDDVERLCKRKPSNY